ncbi:MAG TPA: hypothetical protein DHV31_02105 [Clostridiales bacterium]|nr:hypothetical protein [Clostridiales bacterium]
MIQRKYSGEEKPLKKVLSELFPELSYSELQSCLRKKDVKIDGVRASSDSFLRQGAVVTVYPKKKREIKVIFEDENLLACYKPKGIASEGEISFESIVREEKGDVRLMHRLDTNTDGVLLFTKNQMAYQEVFVAMKEGRIVKTYTAEVYGHPPAGKEVALDYFYKKDAEKGRALISDREKSGFVPVHISFHVIKQKEESSVVSVLLHKGKMHQIRAMLAFYGCFILGDGKYGSDEVNRRLGVTKTALTASAISFELPPNSPLAYLNTIKIAL